MMANLLNSTSGGTVDDVGGLSDILSMALEQSGFDMLVTPTKPEMKSAPLLSTTITPSLPNSKPVTMELTTPATTNSMVVDPLGPLLLTPPISSVDNTSNIDLVECLSGLEPSQDLSTLLSESGAEYLDPLDISHPPTTMSTPLPANRPSKLTISQTLSNLKSTGNLSIDDVIHELGLDPSINDDKIVPVTMTTKGNQSLPITGRIGSVSITQLDKTIMAKEQLKAEVMSLLEKVQQAPEEVEVEEEEDQFSSADTYANYRPAKLRLGLPHPDPIVESSSLASVEPPQVWFDVKFPSMVIEEARLSSLQLETVVYACQQHMNILADGTRAGFLVGDGAGVGKGRTIAGIIYQNYLEGRKKALWLSVSNDLKYDAIRDLNDVGAKKINVYPLNKFHYGKISGKRNGRVRKGIIFATYSSLIGESSSGGKYKTRLNQLLHWLGPHFDGIIVFDECHKAKNLIPTGASKPSKTGLTVLQLQKKLPKARIVYCSATGASEPKNMAYMSRLGIWGTGTQFNTFGDFIKSVERRGVGAMEIVAMDMKLRGMYIARQLSFAGVSFSIDEISLTPKFISMYDKAVEFWTLARTYFKEASDLMDYEKKRVKTMWGQFWAAHQRFFKYLCIGSKVPSTIKLAKDALKNGECVVIGLQSTGEARTLEQLGQNDGELDGFVSTAKGVLESLVKRHFPSPSTGINWSLFENDPTLPMNRKKRKRGIESVFNSDESSSGWENSDSAMESSDEEEDEKMEEGGEESDEDTGDSSEGEESSSDNGNNFSALGLFGPDEPAWLQNRTSKAKKRKLSPKKAGTGKGRGRRKSTRSGGNYSIKPPKNVTGQKGEEGELKFNYKTLRFERFTSKPSDTEINKKSDNPNSTAQNPVIPDKEGAEKDERSLLEVMSSSALSTGSQSGLRHVTVRKMKEELEKRIEALGPSLPHNSLDQLIDGLGGPAFVAELTGRRGRVVTMADGSVQYQLRTESDISIEMLNVTEKQRFMDGEKSIAVISEAASSGISLQADKRVKNQKRRVHITLELPWSADKAIQQFGRTHRSNQVSAPSYVFLISKLSGEQRFASIVAKRLESLGALTHGDRRATESRDLSRYNIDTKFGRQSLEITLKSLVDKEQCLVKSKKYDQEFLDNARIALTSVEILSHDQSGILNVEKESLNISRFLNRLLGLPVELQNKVFSYFTDTLDEVIRRAKRSGRWDSGILDFGASGEEVGIVSSDEFVGDPAFGTATTQLHKIQVERGMSFAEALKKLNTDHQKDEGFYLSKKLRNDKLVAVMLKSAEDGKLFFVHRPNTAVQSRPEQLTSLLKKYTLCTPEEAEKWWNLQYTTTLSSCSHAFWQGKCRLTTPTHPCEVGMRRRTYHVLTGSLLGVWSHLEGVFARFPSQNHKMQIIRVHCDKKKLVGILIPTLCVDHLKYTLEKVAEQAAGTADMES